MSKAATPKRGDVWFVDFDPAVGAEIHKIRPAVVVSVNTVGRLPLRMVVPVTDWQRQYAGYPWFVELPASPSNGLTKDSGTLEEEGPSSRRFGEYPEPAEIPVWEVDQATRLVVPLIGSNPAGRCPRQKVASVDGFHEHLTHCFRRLKLLQYEPSPGLVWTRV